MYRVLNGIEKFGRALSLIMNTLGATLEHESIKLMYRERVCKRIVFNSSGQIQ